jgi:hypothetical protein
MELKHIRPYTRWAYFLVRVVKRERADVVEKVGHCAHGRSHAELKRIACAAGCLLRSGRRDALRAVLHLHPVLHAAADVVLIGFLFGCAPATQDHERCENRGALDLRWSFELTMLASLGAEVPTTGHINHVLCGPREVPY